MKHPKLIITILSISLVASNLWWLYHAIDNGVTNAYMDDSMQQTSRTLKETIAILPLVANGSSKESIIKAASDASQLDPFEKDGYVWVGFLGLKFNESGKFIGVSPE
jgi:hypothetical protein